MARPAAGSLLACASLFAFGCGKSVSSSNDGENAGQGGSSGTSATGGSAGTAMGIEPYFQPGTRLKPLVIAAGPGLDIIEHSVDGGWHDSELDFDCFFAADEKGVERCFPAAILGGFVYGDASCTRPVFIDLGPGSGACDGPRYEYITLDEFASESCGVSGLHLGDELPATTPLFSMEGSTCEPLTLPPTPSHVYELEAVPPETFVGLHRVRRPRAPGLDAYVREGDDGSWQVLGYFDPARDLPCFDLDTSPPKCIPPWAASSGYFADAACETRISEVGSDGCSFETPTTIIDFHLDASVCPPVQPFDLYEIAGARETLQYYPDASKTCTAAGFEPSEVWIQGASIDLSTLPSLETLLVGTGPVHGRFSGFDGAPFLPDLLRGPLVDAASGVGCEPVTISDGTLRCVPTSFLRVDTPNFFYESSSCSGARVIFEQPLCLPGPLPQGIALLGASTECTGERIIAAAIAVVGRSAASTLYFTNSMTGACEPVEGPSPGVHALLLGESLNPAEIFAPIERTIRQ